MRKTASMLASLNRKFIPDSWRECSHFFRESFSEITCLYCARRPEELLLLSQREGVRKMPETRECKTCGEQVDLEDFSSEASEVCIYCEDLELEEEEEEEEDED